MENTPPEPEPNPPRLPRLLRRLTTRPSAASARMLAGGVAELVLIVYGALVTCTGALHFVNNTPGSFEIKGMTTNATFAVVLVAVVLMLTGIVTMILALFRVIRCSPVPPFLFGTPVVDAVWFLVLSCLTFFMTGVLGLVTGILCFLLFCALLVFVFAVHLNRRIPRHSAHEQLHDAEQELN